MLTPFARLKGVAGRAVWPRRREPVGAAGVQALREALREEDI